MFISFLYDDLNACFFNITFHLNAYRSRSVDNILIAYASGVLFSLVELAKSRSAGTYSFLKWLGGDLAKVYHPLLRQ